MYKSQNVVDLEMHDPNPPVGDPSVGTACSQQLSRVYVSGVTPFLGHSDPCTKQGREMQTDTQMQTCSTCSELPSIWPGFAPQLNTLLYPILLTPSFHRYWFQISMLYPKLVSLSASGPPPTCDTKPCSSLSLSFPHLSLSFPLPHLVSWTVPS